MKKLSLLFLTIFFTVVVTGLLTYKSQFESSNQDITHLKKSHKYFLNNSPFKETLKLSKEERKARGMAPNKYSERMWELTMNPEIGRPETEKLFQLQKQLSQDYLLGKMPGTKDNNWVERGPNNVGGRTRAIMYDPNDPANKRVFAGGVSGGLWVNNDITDANSVWQQVSMPKNLAISCITYDPNNTHIFYVGTGESYVYGDVNGNGVWKSVDGGETWFNIFGGASGETNIIEGTHSGYDAKITVNDPASLSGNYFGFRANFGPTLNTIEGKLRLADDGSDAPNAACFTIKNKPAIKGRIALVFRGSCGFETQVKNAQEGGAVAVIVANNIFGKPYRMYENIKGLGITIPSIMISLADGEALANVLESGDGINITLNRYANYSGYQAKPGNQHINDIKVRDVGNGKSEVYVAAGTTFFSDDNSRVLLGAEDYGLYKSADDGDNWSKLNVFPVPNDIEITTDNKVWVSTIGNFYGDGGGEIFSSTDGTNFTLKHKIPNGLRTQIAVSKQDASTLYVLAELSDNTKRISLLKTTDAFATEPVNINKPDDVDPSIPNYDFARGQAFYNLMLEIDPTDDRTVYVGGINLFRSSDSGNNWDQLSHRDGGFGYQNVHADQHALVFNPSNPDEGVFGNDGGVYYASSLSEAATTGISGITPRERNYNTLQFYNGAIGQDDTNEKLLAGSQDNGTQFINNAAAGINSSTKVSGGDGAYVFIDKDNEYVISSAYHNIYYYLDYTSGARKYAIDFDLRSGDFINPAALDSETNQLYSNGTRYSTYQVNIYTLGTNSATKRTIKSPLLDSSPTAFKVLPAIGDKKQLLVGTENGKLFKVSIDDMDATWTALTGVDFIGSISSIETGTSENDIYVTFYNYGVSNVFYSNNGGNTWQDKEHNLPDIPVRAIMPNPLNNNEVILGTDLGVWGTKNFNDANPNWTQAQNGMKDVKVTSFDLRIADNTVLASTFGRGMFTGQFKEDESFSVEQIANTDAIKVYPTISDGNFKVRGNNSLNNGILNIYDLNGKAVYSSKMDFVNNVTQNISLNTASGVYVVKFKFNNVQSTHKIVVN